MKYIESSDATTGEVVRIAYSDYGKGNPVVLIHGWPSSREMWEHQLEDLVNAGNRVIKYDRRGFGKSDKPWNGYDYDSLSDDLHALLEQLDLQQVTLVGFSMGGGEVARYLSRHGDRRIAKAVFIASVLPFFQKNDDNADGVDRSVFEEMATAIRKDRLDFIDGFGKKFFGVNMISKPVSKAALDYYAALCTHATSRSTLECLNSFAETDFRGDIATFKVPVLIIHGDADKTVPIEVSSDRLAKMLPGASYKIYEGAPHGLFVTHKEELNEDLIAFIQHEVGPAKNKKVVAELH